MPYFFFLDEFNFYVHLCENPNAVKFWLKSSESEILVGCLTGTAVRPDYRVELHLCKQTHFDLAFFKDFCRHLPVWISEVGSVSNFRPI